jgi:hypothetical protein
MYVLECMGGFCFVILLDFVKVQRAFLFFGWYGVGHKKQAGFSQAGTIAMANLHKTPKGLVQEFEQERARR